MAANRIDVVRPVSTREASCAAVQPGERCREGLPRDEAAPGRQAHELGPRRRRQTCRAPFAKAAPSSVPSPWAPRPSCEPDGQGCGQGRGEVEVKCAEWSPRVSITKTYGTQIVQPIASFQVHETIEIGCRFAHRRFFQENKKCNRFWGRL